MYRNLGIGGDAANEVAAKQNFVDRFMQQVKQNQKASATSGMPLDVNQMVQSYLGQYGWVVSPAQQAKLSQMADAVGGERGLMGGASMYAPKLKQLANAMYMIGSQQLRDPKTGLTIQGAGGQGGGSAGGQASAAAEPEQLSPATEQIVQRIQKLLGSENNDDLEIIAKTAMQVLYKQNPTAYTELYKEIMTGETKKKARSPEDIRKVKQARAARVANRSAVPGSKPVADTGENPNIVQGYNESRRR
jgi:hypothetical protein